MSSPRYTFVWWGDGYLVYDNGAYIGKDDQLFLLDFLVEGGLAEKYEVSEEELKRVGVPDRIEEFNADELTPTE